MKKLFLLVLTVVYTGQMHGQIISTYAGNGYGQGTGTTGGYAGDGGQATSAEFFFPYGIEFDKKGNLYIGDQANMVVRKVTPSGIVSTVAGNGLQGFSGDSGQAIAAKLNNPTGIAFDSVGNMYICDTYNFRVRKVDTLGIITTIAGNGTWSYSGDGGQATAAGLSNVSGVTFDHLGNLYICDGNNYCVRKVTPSGIISTVAGNGTQGFSGDGGLATLAELNQLGAIAFDSKSNLYIADFENHRIRKVNTSGIITTIAGNGINAFSGDGGPAINAELNYPSGITVDWMDNIYISDGGVRVRKIDTIGIITTVVGNGGYGYTGDGGPSTSAKLNHPQDLAFDTLGNLFIADYWNNKIRMVTNIAGLSQYLNIILHATIFPNPTSDQFFIETNSADKQFLEIFDLNGKRVFNQIINEKVSIDVSNLNEGVYTIRIKAPGSIINKKLVIVR